MTRIFLASAPPQAWLLLLGLLLSHPAGAQVPPASGSPLLHELVPDSPVRRGAAPPPGSRAASAAPTADPTSTRDPRIRSDAQTGLPEAIMQDGLGLLAPDEEPTAGAEESIYLPGSGPHPGGSGLVGAPPGAIPPPETQRAERAVLDRQTGPDGLLTYREVFNPSIAPFKRDAAFDQVQPDESLAVRPGPLTPVTPDGSDPEPGWDPFWGSLILELTPTTATPIPSVAPEARLLAYQTKPQVPLQFFRDGADNFWVQGPPGYAGRLRLIFLTAARATAFGGPVPDFGLRDVPSAIRPTVPPPVRQRAAGVLQRLGLRPGSTPPPAALATLIRHFRSFTAGDPPAATGSLYLDLTLARRGVCRHRAQAFVITAQTFGLPARYVHNEAHAFAEVFLPGQGWRRVDLGGASAGLRVHNGLGKVQYEPRFADPFPQPEEYQQSYSAPPGGDDPASTEPAGAPAEQAGPGTTRPAGPTGPGLPAGPPRPHPAGPGLTAPDGGLADEYVVGDGGLAPPPGARAVPPAAPPPEPRVPVLAILQEVAPQAFRGERVQVAGRARRATDGQPAPHVPVVLLASRRGGLPVPIPLAVLQTDDRGDFRGSIPLPPDLPPGGYDLRAEDGWPYVQ